ncbi:MAG: hypothetical protein II399_04245 [Lachnospiraceae bacterium]|jgi:hypothetical protein|nr:hypothetical protein [Lachnospiraceae bacterium]
MNFSDYIYVDDYCFSKFDEIKENMEKRKKIITDPFFVIILNEYTSKLEFCDWMFLLQRHYKNNPPLIVGLAKDYDSAEELTCHMIENCLIKVGNLDYIAYLASLPEIEEGCVLPKMLKISGGKMYA